MTGVTPVAIGDIAAGYGSGFTAVIEAPADSEPSHANASPQMRLDVSFAEVADGAEAGGARSVAAAAGTEVAGGPGAEGRTALESAAAGLDEEARSLLSLIGREAATLDAIAEKARNRPRFRNAAAHRLLAGLLELELKGRVKRMPGALFKLA
jgi:hypothetical protein